MIQIKIIEWNLSYINKHSKKVRESSASRWQEEIFQLQKNTKRRKK